MNLYDAADAGDPERVQVLVERGADKEKVTNKEVGYDTTPLSIASRNGHLPVVQYLVEQGVDKEMKDFFGWTPLYIASRNGHIGVVRYLVEQGSNMEKTSGPRTWTPLHVACIEGCSDVVRYLLEQGADRDKACDNGSTPLHLAAEKGHLETAKLLMVYGADLNARNFLGQLPIDFAGTEEIKQAIRDEPRRRMDEAPGKRATEQDRHPNTATSTQQERDGGDKQCKKKPRLEEGVGAEEGMVAEEDEDSEPSDEEDD